MTVNARSDKEENIARQIENAREAVKTFSGENYDATIMPLVAKMKEIRAARKDDSILETLLFILKGGRGEITTGMALNFMAAAAEIIDGE